jgi:hypothetical protein
MARSPGERTGRPAPEAGRSDVAVDVELTIAFGLRRGGATIAWVMPSIAP